jgi:hypothetical protein
MAKYYQITEGEWVRVVKRGYRHACCDCAMTHILDHREKDGKFEIRYRIDRRATAAARRAFNFTPDDE